MTIIYRLSHMTRTTKSRSGLKNYESKKSATVEIIIYVNEECSDYRLKYCVKRAIQNGVGFTKDETIN